MGCSRRFLTLVLALPLTLLLADPVQAHQFAPSLLKVVQVQQHEYSVVWKTPSRPSGSTPLLPVMPEGCEITGKSPRIQDGTGLLSRWQLHCNEAGAEGLTGQTLAVTGLVENQASSLVMISLLNGRHYQRVLNSNVNAFTVPAAHSQVQVVIGYPILGIEHILGGPDHLLFVLGLLLLVGGGARLLWTVTAFTVGHSITLAMVTLGLFDYPVALIEFAIALSIFVLALAMVPAIQKEEKNAWQRIFRDHPWWLAGGFGLLHGMGFAGALSEIGLPQGNLPFALLSFNIGIEIGQILFILAVLSAWWLLRRTSPINLTRLLPIPVYLLGGLSAMWCIERGLEVLS